MHRAAKILAWALGAIVLALLWAWTSAVIYYLSVPWQRAAALLAWGAAIGGPLALAFLPHRGRTLAVMTGAFLVSVVRYATVRPSNERDWRPEVSRIADAELDGQTVLVRNVRNFDYRSETDFELCYEDRTYDLRKLQATDILFSYWDGNEGIAHTMLSFDFGEGDVLALSVEVRREKLEGWGGLPGAFKQFEIIYVLADERDVVRLRTNYRKESVYLFRMALTPDESRALLRHILWTVHDLNSRPVFYRTIGRNCTTSLVGHMNAVWPDRIPFHKQLLMNGLLPQHAYERGQLGDGLPLEEVLQRHNVNVQAEAADQDPDFSLRIRAHLTNAQPASLPASAR